MAINNPYVPGDPYSYDLKWIVRKIKEHSEFLSTIDEKIAKAVQIYLDQHDPVYFQTAEDLITVGGNPESLAYIQGYYEPGDGGANLYYVTDDFNDVLAADFYLTLGPNLWAIPVITTDRVTPEMFGAYGDGTNDDTAAFAVAAKYPAVFLAHKTYMLASVDFTDVNIESADATLKKNAIADQSMTFVSCANSVITGNLTVHGNRIALNETVPNTTGINLINMKVTGQVYAMYCSRHGVRVESNCDIFSAKAEYNGVDVNQAGDGIYITNAENTVIHSFEVTNNARNGLASTTYPINNAVGGNVFIMNGTGSGNGLTDVDIEAVNTHDVSNIVCGRLYCSNTVKSKFYSLTIKDRIYGTGSNTLSFNDVYIYPSDQGQYIYLNGGKFTVRNVRIFDTAATYTSTAVQIVDDGTAANIVENVIVENSYNGMELAGLRYASGLKVIAASNRWLTLNTRRLSQYAFDPNVRDGAVIVRGSTSGVITTNPAKGDTVINSEPAEAGTAGSKYVTYGWVHDGSAWKQMRVLTGA